MNQDVAFFVFIRKGGFYGKTRHTRNVADEQVKLYEQLRHYNEGRESYKVSGVYLLVLPHDNKPKYSLWCYSPELERNPILFIQDLSEQIQESLRMATSMFFCSKRKLLIVEYNEKHMASKGES